MVYNENMKAISLFSSAGIGDLALEKNGIEVIVANELLADRVSMFAANFPKAATIAGDIWELKEEIVTATRDALDGAELDFFLATPPCQGMSKNGQGKLLNETRRGNRPHLDPRNRLIIPTMDIAVALRPRVLVLENVPEMRNTIIEDEKGEYVNVVEYVRLRLGDEYEGKAEVVQFADYGVPQRLQRLITFFSRDERLRESLRRHGTLLPERTHASEAGLFRKRWVTVRDIVADLPFLDAKDKPSATSAIPYHRVSVLEPKKYKWIAHTPPEKGAFDNQCANQKCGYDKNPTHGSEHDGNGVNRARTDTPIYCVKCGELLPRPFTIVKDGKKRLMNGYTSAYKRMRWDLPAPTLTTNLSYPSSDHKLHPTQNRVLSLYEAFKLHTLDRYDYHWKMADGSVARDSLIREVIGESIPPYALEVIFSHLIGLVIGQDKADGNAKIAKEKTPAFARI